MLDGQSTMLGDAARGGRVSRKERMTRPRYQDGCLWIRGKRKVWVLRWRENVLQPDGSVRRILRAETLGPVSKITRQQARDILQQRLGPLNLGQVRPQSAMTFADFVQTEWKPNAGLALKRSSVRYYQSQLGTRILPVLGPVSLCSLKRLHIDSLLSELRRTGYPSAMLRGVRATVSTVLQNAVERGYLDRNPAHGIRISETGGKTQRRSYSPTQIQKLLPELSEPCGSVVRVAVLTGLRIGEILALRWKRVDLLRNTIEVAETFSDGHFGSPKTRSSRRVVPISGALRETLATHRSRSVLTDPEHLVFATSKGTPLNSKNLYNRVLAPACDRIKEARVSWHSFRHTHATLLAEVGESIKTAQALLGHSDLETTLNTYAHAIPSSQRRAVDRLADVLFSNVLNSSENKRELKN
jgi:integrase